MNAMIISQRNSIIPTLVQKPAILNLFYKGTKVSLIHPLLVHNDTVADFNEKPDLLNDFLLLSVH